MCVCVCVCVCMCVRQRAVEVAGVSVCVRDVHCMFITSYLSVCLCSSILPNIYPHIQSHLPPHQ